ncbi:MAG TPA: DsrE family protein [Candidatus Limnocylindria bacterium]|jgi:predicted peroxiredoxin
MATLLITTTSGPGDPTRASLAFHMAANGAAKNQIETSIAIAGDAAELLKPGAADAVRGVGVPPLAELLAGCISAGVRIFV